MSEFSILDYDEIESEIWGTPPKRKKDWEFDVGHFVLGVFLFFIVLVQSCTAWWDNGVESRCERLCEPYRLESCGEDSRTATCRTPEGYVVRVKPPIVPARGR